MSKVALYMHNLSCTKIHTKAGFVIWGMWSHIINLLRHAFYCTSKTDMNPSRQAVFHMPRSFLTINFFKLECKKDQFPIYMLQYLFKSVHMFYVLCTYVFTNDVACYLAEIPLPNQKSITDKWIPILQVVNKTIRLTQKLFMSLSKVYVKKGGVHWFFMINEVNLLFYIIR